MLCKEITINAGEQLQPRLAAALVREACKYSARICIKQEGKIINVKSMMGVLSIAPLTTDKLNLVIEGEDEEQAMQATSPLLEDLFAVVMT